MTTKFSINPRLDSGSGKKNMIQSTIEGLLTNLNMDCILSNIFISINSSDVKMALWLYRRMSLFLEI